MEAFEAAFNAQQNSLPPSERADEESRNTIMVDRFVYVAGGMPRNRVRGQGNTSSLVIRTPMGYRLDPSQSFNSVGSSSRSTAPSYSAADFEEMERRLKANSEARLGEMRTQLRQEAMQDVEVVVQRALSQRDQGYQRQQQPPIQPARHSAYASSQPHQQQPRHSVPHIPPRHSVHETSQFRPMPYQRSSSLSESGGSSQQQSFSYQQFDYRPTFDSNQPTTSVPFNVANVMNNVNMMSNQEMMDQFLNSDNQHPNVDGGTRGNGNANFDGYDYYNNNNNN
jgi:hypothetical protein